ncbi:MAG: CPBP family intramembrane glutamic endopeptidase [Hyphomicrobium aestuarii]|nr:CPBP family intramembrane glutamic endopeptidase [Hyphomicrobium aestuarii]
MAAGFGPSLAGVAVVALFSTGAGFRGWLARCWKWRMNWRWYALAFAGPPVAMVCALVLHAELGGAIPTLPAADKIPLVIANFALVLLIGGPLGEEFGWRGYAMPALTARLNWRAAALIVGVLWGLWHLPLFFLAGTAQSQIPIALFMINIVASSVVFGWLFEHTKRSVLPVIVLHTSVNAWAGILLLPLATTGETYALVTTFFVVVAVVLLFRTGSGPGLGRGDDATSQQSC